MFSNDSLIQQMNRSSVRNVEHLEIARMSERGGIIDAHVHIWTPNRKCFPRDQQYRGPDYEPLSFTVDEMLSVVQPCGVNRVVLVQMSFYGPDNSYIVHAIRSHPGVFCGIAVVDYNSPTLAFEIERLRALGIRGFRIAGNDHRASVDSWLETAEMHKLWTLAAEKRLAICPLIDVDSIPALDRMCTTHPNTIVVIDHMAGIGSDGEIRTEEIQLLCRLARHPHVFVKISAFYAFGKKHPPYVELAPMIQALFEAYGASRLMWGSDSPFQVQSPHTYASSLELVRDRLAFLVWGDVEWLIRKTAEQVFFQEKYP